MQSTLDRVRRKPFLERLYIHWNERDGSTPIESLRKAVDLEDEFIYMEERRGSAVRDMDMAHFFFAKQMLLQHMTNETAYVVADDFMDALAEKGDLKVSKSYLLSKLGPSADTITIELPYAHRYETEIVGRRSFCKTAIISSIPQENGDRWVFLSFPYSLEETAHPRYIRYENPLDPSDTKHYRGIYVEPISFILHNDGVDMDVSESVTTEKGENHRRFLQNIVKVLLYIKSDGELDLRSEKPEREITTKNPKKAKKQMLDLRHFPVIHVGWGFKKSPIYQKGEWRSRGHFRWQPYGSREIPLYKLIWIDEMVKRRQVESELDRTFKGSSESHVMQ